MDNILLALALLSLGLERFITGWHPQITGLLCILAGIFILI